MTCYIKSFIKYSRGLSIKKLKENEGLKSKTIKIQKYVMFKVALLRHELSIVACHLKRKVWIFMEWLLKSDFQLRKLENPHQPRLHNPRWQQCVNISKSVKPRRH